MLPWLLATMALAGAPAGDPAPTSDDPDRSGWAARQTWPLVAEGELASLGFHPTGRHGGAAVGTELTHVRRPVLRLVQPLALGYMAQRPLLHGPLLSTGLEVRAVAPFGLYGGLGLRAAVRHVFAAAPTWTATGDGFVRTPDRGRTHASVSLGAELGFELGSVTSVPLRLFARWEQRVLAPFAPRNDLPAMVQAAVVFGVAIHLREEPHR